MVVQYLESTIREKHFSSRDIQLEKPGAAAATGESKGKGKTNNGKVNALEERSVE